MRIAWIDCARGAAIVTIVFFHCALAITGMMPVHWSAWALIQLFAPVPIALFFFISGFLGRSIIASSWRELATRRVAPLLYAFAAWSLIGAGIEMALGLHGLPSPGAVALYLVNPDSSLWFIWALAIFFCGARLVNRAPRAWVFAAVAILAFLDFAAVTPRLPYVYENLVRFFPFFLGGLWWCDRLAAVERRPFVALAVCGIAYGGLSLALFALSLSLQEAGALKAVLAVTAIPLGVAASIVASRIPGFRRALFVIGQLSLPIYLIHPTAILLLVALAQFTGLALPAAVWAMPGLTLLVLGLTAAIGLATSRAGLMWLYRPPVPERFRLASSTD